MSKNTKPVLNKVVLIQKPHFEKLLDDTSYSEFLNRKLIPLFTADNVSDYKKWINIREELNKYINLKRNKILPKIISTESIRKTTSAVETQTPKRTKRLFSKKGISNVKAGNNLTSVNAETQTDNNFEEENLDNITINDKMETESFPYFSSMKKPIPKSQQKKKNITPKRSTPRSQNNFISNKKKVKQSARSLSSSNKVDSIKRKIQDVTLNYDQDIEPPSQKKYKTYRIIKHPYKLRAKDKKNQLGNNDIQWISL